MYQTRTHQNDSNHSSSSSASSSVVYTQCSTRLAVVLRLTVVLRMITCEQRAWCPIHSLYSHQHTVILAVAVVAMAVAVVLSVQGEHCMSHSMAAAIAAAAVVVLLVRAVHSTSVTLDLLVMTHVGSAHSAMQTA
jgi:hypothetical protein